MTRTVLIVALFFFAASASAQDTFSIVAVDLETGQVGSAGASCIDSSSRISDVHPGRGAIHTQALWTAENQAIGRSLMERGDTPQEIIDSLVAREGELAGRRQYGAVDNIDGGRSAGFTGVDNFFAAGHINGATYAIQGNILIGLDVLASMEQGFLNAQGTLAQRLMATLQAVNFAGADSRCLSEGRSSRSAFIRVAKADDSRDNLFLDLDVPSAPPGVEPIDTLQVLFDEWLMATSVPEVDPQSISQPYAYPNPFGQVTTILFENTARRPVELVEIFDLFGRIIRSIAPGPNNSVVFRRNELATGAYYFAIRYSNGERMNGSMLIR